MQRLLAIMVVCGFSGVAFAFNDSADKLPPSSQPADKQFIVHEWGTFTGFAGSDGVHLPFGIGIGSELPSFVLNRRIQGERLNVKINPWGDFAKGEGIFALQRMETPVIYFYTAQPRNVSVAVDFPQGQLSEFYPPVRAMSPAFGEGPGEARYLERPALPLSIKPATRLAAKFEHGSLNWGEVLLLPQTAERPTYMPEVPKAPEAAAHYQYARETDAATVQFSDRPGEYHNERFLFYRGLGDFTLPITLRAHDDDRFELNVGAAEHPIPFAVLLRINDGRARFAMCRDITGRQSMTLPAETVSPDQVSDALVNALTAQGLFEKEARAMVKTWSSNWLGDAGTRVLYAVPRPITDALLPLRIAPAPDETVRVMVGRIDVLTPSQEARIQWLLSTSLKTKVIAPEDAQCLRNLGRFFDPAIERASRLRASSEGKREVSALRWLYWNAPKPEQQQAAASVTSH